MGWSFSVWWNDGGSKLYHIHEATTQVHALQAKEDMYSRINAKCKQREMSAKTGKLKRVIASMTENYQNRYTMQTLLTPTDDIILDPQDSHATITSHFNDWFSPPSSIAGRPLQTECDWQRLCHDYNYFKQTHTHLNIPDLTLRNTWLGINYTFQQGSQQPDTSQSLHDILEQAITTDNHHLQLRPYRLASIAYQITQRVECLV